MIAPIKGYRGVSCVRCHAPIPVSAKVISFQDQIAQREINMPHAFAARCRLCEHESVYAFRHVRWFDGEPRRISRASANRRGMGQ